MIVALEESGLWPLLNVGGCMRGTTAATFKPCPHKCPDCEEDAHCWRDYEPDRLVCKHCPATISFSEKCGGCGHELIDHWGDDGSDREQFACGYYSLGGKNGDISEAGECACKRFTLTAKRE